MTEPTYDPRPELCDGCAAGGCCERQVTCAVRRDLWDSGYAAGKAAAGQECTLLAASLKEADERAEVAESKLEAQLVQFADALGLINHFEGQAGYERADVALMLQRIKQLEQANGARIEAETKLAELEAERESWKRAADSVAAKYAEQAQISLKCAQGFEAKLAELVREVREWNRREGFYVVEQILAKYAKPEGAL